MHASVRQINALKVRFTTCENSQNSEDSMWCRNIAIMGFPAPSLGAQHSTRSWQSKGQVLGRFSCRIDRAQKTPENFLEIVDELHEIEFISAREAIDTTGAMGRMFITLVGSIAELERSLITERIKAGMRRARLEGQKLGRAPLNIDHDALVRDRLSGMSLTCVARKYRVSRASVVVLCGSLSGVR